MVRNILQLKNLPLPAIILAAGYLRFKGLTFQSHWFDELLSAWRSDPDLTLFESIRISLETVHPPFFQIILWFWYSAFGYTEFSGRLLPVCIGLLGVFSIYFLGKELDSTRTGLLASLITALNAYHIYYSQEVRSYCLVFFLTTLSYLFFLKLMKGGKLKSLALYVLCTVLLLYTHYYGLVVLLSQMAWLGISIVSEKEARKHKIRLMSIAGAAMAVLYSPMLPHVLRNAAKDSFWTKVPKAWFFIGYFKQYFESPRLIFIFTALLIWAIFLVIISDDKKYKQAVAFLFGWIFFGYAFPYLRSLVDTPLLWVRYTIIVLPPFIILFSMATVRVKPGILMKLIIILIVWLSLSDLFLERRYYTTAIKQQWREVIQAVLDENDSLPLVGVKKHRAELYNVYLKFLGSDRRADRYIRQTREIERKQCFWALDGHYRLLKGERYAKKHKLLELDRIQKIKAVAIKYSLPSNGDRNCR